MQSYSIESSYMLCKHVYLCRTDDHVVLLDLKRDEYIGIDQSDSAQLSKYVRDWPRTSGIAGGNSADASESRTLVDQMLAAGIITADKKAGKTIAIVSVPPASVGVVDDYSPFQVRVRMLDTLRFIKAVTAAKVLLNGKSLERAVRRVWARRRTRQAASSSYLHVRNQVAVFLRLRPFLSSACDACLFDSLVLSEFLACYGIFPAWVFGVKTRPFEAHCWLQDGEVILSDSPENVRRFVPIMVV
jgi:hypothetical protein